MIGLQRFLCTLLLFASLVGATSPASAAPNDAAKIADAFGDMTVFMLNVAAGNDGQPQKPQAEQQFKNAFAALFAESYANADLDSQQAVATLPDLDAQLHQAWPLLPEAQRDTLRDQWAASVQQLTPDMPCELFDSMARAQLLPSFGQYNQPNVNHLRQCWRDQPELTHDPEERASGANYGKSVAGPGGGWDSHAAFMGMFNASLYSYTAGMNSASMGTATYSVTSRP